MQKHDKMMQHVIVVRCWEHTHTYTHAAAGRNPKPTHPTALYHTLLAAPSLRVATPLRPGHRVGAPRFRRLTASASTRASSSASAGTRAASHR